MQNNGKDQQSKNEDMTSEAKKSNKGNRNRKLRVKTDVKAGTYAM